QPSPSVAAANATALGYGDTPLSCEDNSPFIEPSSGFDLRHPSSLFNRSSASLATLLSLVSILKHLRNFTKPAQQMHIVRILLFVPIYAIVSWLAFRYYWRAVYIFTARDVYESFVIYSFYALILQYLDSHLAIRGRSTLMTVMALVTQLMSRFCSESMSVKYGHFYYTVINFVSVQRACLDDIAEHKPSPSSFLSKCIGQNKYREWNSIVLGLH
ncbi:DUF300-domain-containing protein, partial [Rhizoclosmatium globosum]